MNEDEHRDASRGTSPSENLDEISIAEVSNFDRIIPRLLRNMLGLSILLLVPAFWFFSWIGALGFAFGAAVSYVNFRMLARGVEDLTDRIVNRNSREKGGSIVLDRKSV